MDLQAALGTGDQRAGPVIADVGVGGEWLCVLPAGRETHLGDQRPRLLATSGRWDGRGALPKGGLGSLLLSLQGLQEGMLSAERPAWGRRDLQPQLTPTGTPVAAPPQVLPDTLPARSPASEAPRDPLDSQIVSHPPTSSPTYSYVQTQDRRHPTVLDRLASAALGLLCSIHRGLLAVPPPDTPNARLDPAPGPLHVPFPLPGVLISHSGDQQPPSL